MKKEITIDYPVNSFIASVYGIEHDADPNMESAKWESSRRTVKGLGIALVAALSVFAAVTAAFVMYKGDRLYYKDAKMEGKIVALAIPPFITLAISGIISLNLFEAWRFRRSAGKKLDEFARSYSAFADAIGSSIEDIERLPEDGIVRICVNTLEISRSKIESAKTKRLRASRLAELVRMYGPMLKMGMRFPRVDSYIYDVRISLKAKEKPKKAASRPKAKAEATKKKRRVAKPAA